LQPCAGQAILTILRSSSTVSRGVYLLNIDTEKSRGLS
jgi:hypothetical protein